jgi:hypothetical protein
VGEMNEAYDKWEANPNGKHYAHLMEEVIDLANSVITFGHKLAKTNNRDADMDMDAVEKMVALKNYLRGYHNEKPLDKEN